MEIIKANNCEIITNDENFELIEKIVMDCAFMDNNNDKIYDLLLIIYDVKITENINLITKYKINTIIKWHRNEYAKEIIENYKIYNRNKINVQVVNYGGNIIPGKSVKFFTEINNIINYYKNIKLDYLC